LKQLLRNLSIGLKVSLAPGLALIGLLLVAVIGWLGNQSLASQLGHIGGAGVDRLVKADAVANRMTDLHQRLYQSLTWEAVGQRAPLIQALDDALLKDMTALDKGLEAAAANAAR
jgi:hypothetical protein